MREFRMNGFIWRLIFVDPFDPELIDRTGEMRVATTNPIRQIISISSSLNGSFLRTVLIHELCHAAMISYGMLVDIHQMTKPKYWIEMEEFICNVIADRGTNIIQIADQLLQ